jgi:hypothetical protein
MASDGWGNPWKSITSGMGLVVVTAVVMDQQNDQRYREADAGCMRSRGHAG